MTRRGRRNVANAVIVVGVFLTTATLFTAIVRTEDALLGAVGAALVAGGWLWRDRFD